MAKTRRIYTSESVTAGHPDKVADQISDAILDAHLRGDSQARVAVETLVKHDQVVIAGEITSQAEVHPARVVRDVLHRIGYRDPHDPFHANGVEVRPIVFQQSHEIDHLVTPAGQDPMDQGAGDQGMMFGYATSESPERLPLPLALAHRITRRLDRDRAAGDPRWLRPDGKAQVSVLYEGDDPVRVESVVVAVQHSDDCERETLEQYVKDVVLPQELGIWYRDGLIVRVNAKGLFTLGGPAADAGLTGRKIMVDTYGGLARHGGGAFSGKDASKVDRSAAYMARLAARTVVDHGLARRCEVQAAYAIGVSRPVSIAVETFRTGPPARAMRLIEKEFDFRPAAIVERLGLDVPGFESVASGGHFGREGVAWERVGV